MLLHQHCLGSSLGCCHLMLVLAQLWTGTLQAPCSKSGTGACGCSDGYEYYLGSSASDGIVENIEGRATREDKDYYYIDDMAFRKRRRRNTQNNEAAAPFAQLSLDFWPGGLIFYLIDSTFSPQYRESILKAMRSIQDNVGSQHLEFREAMTKGGRVCRPTYLYFQRTTKVECVAEIGMQKDNPTHVWLSQESCKPGTIQHEILHALGRYHEQCRPDRDNYVTMRPENILSTQCSNFAKVSGRLAQQDPTLNEPYDSFSIMHYGSCTFSCNGEFAMLRKSGEPQIFPNRESLTELDVKKVRRMFRADSKAPYRESFCSHAIVLVPRGHWVIAILAAFFCISSLQ